MRTGLCSCLSLLQQGNETMADRFLVLVPHELTEGAIRVEQSWLNTHAPRSISARVDSSRPRPVMVCCQTEGDKHAAFKARQFLLKEKIRVDDYLTRAQVAERKERAPLMAHLRTKFPQLIPHWRGSRIFINKEGQGARPYKDTDASQAHDSQPAQAPQPPPAASARPRRPPRPAASRPAQTPAAASSRSSRPGASATAPQASAQAPSPAGPPATAPVEGDPATPNRPKGCTKKVVKRRSGVAQAAANASRAGQLAAAPAGQRARQSFSPSVPSASKPAAAAAQTQRCQQPPGAPSPAATTATPRSQQHLPGSPLPMPTPRA